ncbi:MAG: hypothetical protein Q9222_006392 [Ikaeria aurantiellina]
MDSVEEYEIGTIKSTNRPLIIQPTGPSKDSLLLLRLEEERRREEEPWKREVLDSQGARKLESSSSDEIVEVTPSRSRTTRKPQVKVKMEEEAKHTLASKKRKRDSGIAQPSTAELEDGEIEDEDKPTKPRTTRNSYHVPAVEAPVRPHANKRQGK